MDKYGAMIKKSEILPTVKGTGEWPTIGLLKRRPAEQSAPTQALTPQDEAFLAAIAEQRHEGDGSLLNIQRGRKISCKTTREQDSPQNRSLSWN